MPELSYREAVRDALSQAMRKDDDVFIMGEDIAEMGGSMAVTQGLLDEFGPGRVRNTPISEIAIVGTGIGAAMQGMRPVVEIMYQDFLTLSMEQLVNQAAKHRYMSGGQLTIPVVFRTQGGAGWSPGAQHAQQLEAWFVHVPGLELLRVLRSRRPARPALRPDRERHLQLSARHRPVLRSLVDELLHRDRQEVLVHDLHDRAHALDRGADPAADDRHLGDRGVSDALGTELVEQALRHGHRPAHLGDVLTHDEHALVLAQRLSESVTHGLAIGQLRHRRT